MEFPEVVEAARAVAGQVTQKVASINGLVGISRGGWVPTRLLSSLLSVKQIYSLGLQYTDKARTQLICYDDPAPYLPSEATIVIIEDCLETGNALRYAKEYLGSKGHKVHTAALFITNKSVFIPDFYVERLERPPTFPWEVTA